VPASRRRRPSEARMAKRRPASSERRPGRPTRTSGRAGTGGPEARVTCFEGASPGDAPRPAARLREGSPVPRSRRRRQAQPWMAERSRLRVSGGLEGRRERPGERVRAAPKPASLASKEHRQATPRAPPQDSARGRPCPRAGVGGQAKPGWRSAGRLRVSGGPEGRRERPGERVRAAPKPASPASKEHRQATPRAPPQDSARGRPCHKSPQVYSPRTATAATRCRNDARGSGPQCRESRLPEGKSPSRKNSSAPSVHASRPSAAGR